MILILFTELMLFLTEKWWWTPPTLFIQADNSAKDNKNNYVLMFLAMLVKADIVKKVCYHVSISN